MVEHLVAEGLTRTTTHATTMTVAHAANSQSSAGILRKLPSIRELERDEPMPSDGRPSRCVGPLSGVDEPYVGHSGA
jgi:hypothetical protein